MSVFSHNVLKTKNLTLISLKITKWVIKAGGEGKPEVFYS